VQIEVYQDLAYVGVIRPSELLRKRLRRRRKYAPGQRPLNRSEWKIREALATFDIDIPPGAHVLDIGAAPGGWTSVLARLAREVVAVDPGELDSDVGRLTNVRHLRCRAETLAARDDVGGGFDLLTCDMNVDPLESARIMCLLAKLLKPGTWAVMTVKYTTRQRRQHEREARAALESEYEDIRMRRLPHNARETTAAMRRRCQRGAGRAQ
jgi:predicted rRNA methylase YqxC with S4 and FtsJ domains